MITPVVLTDGRGDLLRATVASFENISGLDYPGVMVNDSGDAMYALGLREKYPWPSWIHARHIERYGLGRSLRDGWQIALGKGADYIWHAEDDFVVLDPLELAPMVEALESDPTLAQLTLKRQPYAPREHAVGDYMLVTPENYADAVSPSGFPYVSHSELFYLNPSLIPRAVVEAVLAFDGPLTEPSITEALAGYHFGVVGRIADAPRVTHIGAERMEGWKA